MILPAKTAESNDVVRIPAGSTLPRSRFQHWTTVMLRLLVVTALASFWLVAWVSVMEFLS